MKEDQFLRDFKSRSNPDLIFLLGAGSSKSSGIPTAWELTWYFKRDIYCSKNSVSPEALKDITLPKIQRVLQDWIKTNFPVVELNEYAFFFEKAYPSSHARKRVINNYVSNSSPSIGYLSLGALIRNKKIRNLVTTNFDNIIEKIYPDVFVVSDESSHRTGDLEIAGDKIQLIKLHGDFRYDKLKNTTDEIKKINEQIQKRLKDFFKEFGIIVVGYSGRDDSIMSFFEQLVEEEDIFSKGFYWCIRKESKPSIRVQSLISKLKSKNLDADFVEIESFDDFLVHLYKQTGIKDEVIEKIIKERYEQKMPFCFERGNSGKPPAIMTNSAYIEEYPTIAHKFETNINTWDELGQVIGSNDIVASLSNGPSIIAIGNRSLIEKVFSSHIKDTIEILNILEVHLNKLNWQHGFVYKLFYDMLNKYFESALELKRYGKRTFWNSKTFKNYDSKWTRQRCIYYQAFSYGLEFRERELFLILNPTILPMQTDGSPLPEEVKKSVQK